jgi:hypothetical protein
MASSQPLNTSLVPVWCRLPNYPFMTSVSWMDKRSDMGMTANRITSLSATNQILNYLGLHLYLCNSDPVIKICVEWSSNTMGNTPLNYVQWYVPCTLKFPLFSPYWLPFLCPCRLQFRVALGWNFFIYYIDIVTIYFWTLNLACHVINL